MKPYKVFPDLIGFYFYYTPPHYNPKSVIRPCKDFGSPDVYRGNTDQWKITGNIDYALW